MTSPQLATNAISGNVADVANQNLVSVRAARVQTLRRLMQKAELFAAKGVSYHLIYARWRIRRLASQWQRQPSLATSLDLVSKFTLELPALEPVRKASAQADRRQLQNALQQYFCTRGHPHFFFTPREKEKIVSLVSQMDCAGRERTIRIADQICHNSFSFRNAAPVLFADGIDWQYCPNGNIDWRWDLNRHAYFESLGRAYWYTGDERYAAKFSALLLDWLAQNPASVSHPSWSSVFEAAFRINTWLWAFHLFQHAPSLNGDTFAALLAGLWTHGNFLNTHLELHAQNNHLLLEAKSLAMLGILFPEFRDAAQWRQRGLAIFCRELCEQTCADGVHGERASLYHRIISGELLELLVLADNNGIVLPSELTHILAKMVEFELWITKPDGQISLVGDSALEDVHLRFSAASGAAAFTQRYDPKTVASPLGESEIWLLGSPRVDAYLNAQTQSLACKPLEMGSRAFSQGGYFIMRSGSGKESAYALFDCGPFGYVRDATHGHADVLSIELYAQGQTWLVDPGVYSTHLGWDWRRYFRGTQSHNTVVVDEQDQSLLLDGRRVYHPANASLHQWVSNKTFDFVAGSHDGYQRLAAPITHRRQLFFVKPHYWVVVDQLTGEGEHAFDLTFHLLPGIKVQLVPSSRAVYASNAGGAELHIVPVNDKLSSVALIEGAIDPIQGWVGLHSGEKQPAPTVRYRRTGPTPTTFCTVLYPQASTKPAQYIQAEELAVITQPVLADKSGMIALRIETDDYRDDLLLAMGTAGVCKHFAEYETDAELVYVRQHKQSGRLLVVETHNGSKLCYDSQPLRPLQIV